MSKSIIFKYKLEIDTYNSIYMPEDSVILGVLVENNKPYVYAQHELSSLADKNTYKQMKFITYATGETIEMNVGDKFIGTFMVFQGQIPFVGHVYHRQN